MALELSGRSRSGVVGLAFISIRGQLWISKLDSWRCGEAVEEVVGQAVGCGIRAS